MHLSQYLALTVRQPYAVLLVIELTPMLPVRGNFGLWPLHKSRHGRDAGLVR